MSDENLLLFPKKRNNSITMSESKTKLILSSSLALILAVAIGVNATLFSQNPSQNSTEMAASSDKNSNFRSIASTQPLFRESWEKKAFEILERSKARDLASVGEKPSIFDKFAFGTLEGHYSIRKLDGKITEIQFADDGEKRPKSLLKREEFIKKNLSLFSDRATSVNKILAENNDERVIEQYQLKGQSGQDLEVVQILLDKDQNLLSMTVQ